MIVDNYRVLHGTDQCHVENYTYMGNVSFGKSGGIRW